MKSLLRYIITILKFPKIKLTTSSFVSFDSVILEKSRIGEKSKVISSKIGFRFSQDENTICANNEIGNNCSLGKNAVVVNSTCSDYVSIGNNVVLFDSFIESHTYVAQDVLGYNVKIGKYSSIGPRVIFGNGDHPVHKLSTSPEFYTPKSSTGHSYVNAILFQEFLPITIGNDVWIGANVYIKHGIKIGDGAIIAAGAVVVKDIPPYSIYGGVPAKEIKKRFNNEVIEILANVKWWNWDDDKIKDSLSLFKKETILVSDLIPLI